MFDHDRLICHVWNQIWYMMVVVIFWRVIVYLPLGEYTSAELIQQMEDDTMDNPTSSALILSYVIVLYLIVLTVMVIGYYITYLIIDCIRGNRGIPYILIILPITCMVFNRNVLWMLACMVYHTVPYLIVPVVIGVIYHGVTSTITVGRECGCT